MSLIIDANVFASFYQESVLGLDPTTTESALPIFEGLDETNQGIIDDRDIIEMEWGAQAETEWFQSWLETALQEDRIRRIPIETYPALVRALQTRGFPTRGASRDVWYVRTAKAVSLRAGVSRLISEDIDFFDPREKRAGSARKEEFLRNRRGRILRFLEDNHDIYVHSVASSC